MPESAASAQLRGIAVRLKAAGAGDLKLQMSRGLRTGAAPLIVAVKASAREKLPHTGGLNEQVASQRVSVSVLTGARTAGVRLVTRAPDTKQTDEGYVRHPVFGHRERWVRQEIPQAAGWWSGTLADSAPLVTAALLTTLHEVETEIQGRGI